MWIVLLLFLAVKTGVSIQIYMNYHQLDTYLYFNSHNLSIFLQRAADLAIQLPASNSVSFASSLQQAYYRLDYQPPYGNPPANTTIAAQDIGIET